MKRILLILVVLLALAVPANSEEYKCALTFGIYTYHYVDGTYTEGIDNRLLAFEYDGWNFANFVNSYGNETQFVGYGWHTDKFYAPDSKNWWVRGNLYAGALVGYGKRHPLHIGAVSPGLYPTGSIGYDRYSLEIGMMPGFVWTGFKIEF